MGGSTLPDAPAGPDRLRQQTDEALRRLRGVPLAAELAELKLLARTLRDRRLMPELLQLAEALARRDAGDALVQRLYAQALIDQGLALAAIALLKPLAARLGPAHPEWSEAMGLQGRAWKQIFVESPDPSGHAAREALRQAVAAYRKPYAASPGQTWHGVNLLALLVRARQTGIRLPGAPRPEALAQALLQTLAQTPPARRDVWHAATVAEVCLATGEPQRVQAALKDYIGHPEARAFMIGSTLRQFTELWQLDQDPVHGQALVQMLRARQLALADGALTLSPAGVQLARRLPAPAPAQLEAVLGQDGVSNYAWYRKGLDRATGVCAVRDPMGARLGTGWLVSAGALGLQPADELLVLTNHHVVNPAGDFGALTPDQVELVFEAADAQQGHRVSQLLATSPPDALDFSLLRLQQPVSGIEPLPLAQRLPALDQPSRVYLIGHPGGRELAFSLQDNELLDHEGPPGGTPPLPGRWRVHYRAPTEGGSSGSPVFNARLWEVIALHHSGGKLMQRLNGRAGSYPANEGIALGSIRDFLAAHPPGAAP